jgi:hypothetical protein
MVNGTWHLAEQFVKQDYSGSDRHRSPDYSGSDRHCSPLFPTMEY